MKLNIKKITAFAGLLSCLIVPSLVQAQVEWTLIDDFESYAEGAYLKDGTPDLVYPIATNGGRGGMDIFTGIEGIGGEKAAWFWYGEFVQFAGDVWHYIPLPKAIGVNETATITFRLWVSAYDINLHILTTRDEAGTAPDATALWGNMCSILRQNNSEPLMLDARDGTGYANSNPIFLPELATWYQFWMVLENNFDGAGNQAGVGGYTTYVQGPNDAEPYALSFGGDTTKTFLDFRNQNMDSIKSLSFIQNSQTTSNVWLLDDIYMADGDAINGGGGDTWCGYDLAAENAVDTGSWMGWINVSSSLAGAPGWVWSYDLGKYVYVSACPDAGGAWVYVQN